MIKPAVIQVRFADLDTMGHVNNSVYLTYFEYARVYYFNEMFGVDWDWDKYGVLIVRNEINYIKPVLLNDKPEVEVMLESVGNKSFTLAYEIRVNGEVTTTGKSVSVGWDTKNNCTRTISDEYKAGLAKLRQVQP